MKNLDQISSTFEERGAWLLGSAGTEKVITLAAELYRKIKKREEIHLQREFEAYSPWMSMEEARDELSPLYDRELPDVLAQKEVLQILAKAFRDGSEIPLGRLRFDRMHSDQYIYDGDDFEEAEFISRIREARNLYLDCSSTFRERWEGVVCTIVPLKVLGTLSDNRAAFSSHLLRGAVFRAIPRTKDEFWRLDLAIDLAHELGHQALILYQAADPIIISDLAQKVFSGIRQTDRPSIMSFHAAAALAYMIEYLESQLGSDENRSKLLEKELYYAESELTKFYRQLQDTLDSCKKLEFSELGTHIFNEYRSLVR